MKNSKKDFGIAGQSTTEAKKSHKHDANLQKNSTFYFQIGLILCLLGTYALFEMEFQETKFNFVEETAQVEKVTIDYVPPFIVEVIEPTEPEPLPSTDLKDIYKVVENDVPVVETIVNTPDIPAPQLEPIDVGAIVVLSDPIDDEVFVPFSRIEKVPVYPGCEKYTTNDDRKKCMSKKITKLIGKKFNVDIGSEYGISGRQKISTQFTIDKKGNVTDIKIRGPHHALENEAKRVINKIPKMQPGLQRQTPVGVIYTLPIIYDARN